MTWGDLVVFNGLELFNSPTTKVFHPDGIPGVQLPMTPTENEKRLKLLNQYVLLKAYYNRILEHPMLANYFKHRLQEHEIEY